MYGFRYYRIRIKDQQLNLNMVKMSKILGKLIIQIFGNQIFFNFDNCFLSGYSVNKKDAF